MLRGFYIFLVVVFCVSCKENKPAMKFSHLDYKKPRRLKIPNLKPVFILDAGHGGEDPGAINDSLKLYEKNVSRKIVDAMLKILDTNKVRVIQTRIGDQTTDRHYRLAYASTFNPDLLMTVHNNFSKDTTINGFEISYSDSTLYGFDGADTIKQLNPFKKEVHNFSQILKENVALSFPKMKARNIAVRKDDIWMIYAGDFPSILVEFGFISNKNDVAILMDEKELKKLAKTLVSGIYKILNVKK